MGTKLSTNSEVAIGAFCTDIVESVIRIDKYDKRALEHHADYIENVAKMYVTQLTTDKDPEPSSNLQALFMKSRFWIPGDALWGLVYRDPDETAQTSIVNSFAKIINSCAYGLIKVYEKANALKIDHLKIRAALIGGQVLGREISGTNAVIYNGASLNACGRLQSETDSDSIVLGFAVPKDEPEPFNLVNLNVGIPEIELSALGKFILEPTIKFPELQFIQP
ncbi:hypothetical protein ACFLRT_04925, partial [Acidobacteriota bacterium]